VTSAFAHWASADEWDVKLPFAEYSVVTLS